MRFFLFLVLFIDLFLLTSCKKYVPADAVFFIQPKLVSVVSYSVPVDQGSGSSKITDLWLYVNGQFQGAYPTGSRMPIITKGQKVKVNILPGIKNNGISGTRLSWVFYNFISFDTLVENGKTIDRPLTFHYNPNTTFEWMEDFDKLGYTLIKSVGDVNNYYTSDTMWKIASPADSFEGKSAEIGFSESAAVGSIAQFESSIDHTMPQGSTTVYLEVNYKGNQGFEVGVIADGTSKSTVFVNASSGWNKIYIQLADAINRLPKETKQKVYFKMIKSADNATPKVFLDNIKLVYL